MMSERTRKRGQKNKEEEEEEEDGSGYTQKESCGESWYIRVTMLSTNTPAYVQAAHRLVFSSAESTYIGINYIRATERGPRQKTKQNKTKQTKGASKGIQERRKTFCFTSSS